MIRTYTELSKLQTFEERFRYLKLNGVVGEETFGFDRWLNQRFYKQSVKWKHIRNEIIVRDCGCDLGVDSRPIYGKILIHHMNPITVNDLSTDSDFLLNPEYLIATSLLTHNAIHYGDERLLIKDTPVERYKNDLCPWRH
jgi:hypothetical protein